MNLRNDDKNQKVSISSPKSGLKSFTGPSRDKLGQFSSGSGGLRALKKFNWGRALPLIVAVTLVGGYLVVRSFAGSTDILPNPYTCIKVNGEFPALKQGDNDINRTADSQCVHAVQYALKNKGKQSQIKVVSGIYDADTVSAVKNFETYFKYSATNKDGTANGNGVDGTKISPLQMSAIDRYFNSFKTTLDPTVKTWDPSYPGQPRPGKVYWGSSKQSNGDVSQLEADGKAALGIHRTFWSLYSPDSAVATARADLLAGRIPVLSFSVPAGDWAAIGSGLKDGQVNILLNKLNALKDSESTNGPIFIAIQHEPEDNGGQSADHIAMNKRVRYLMTAIGTKNIALTQILVGADYTDGAKYPAADWYADGIYDILGVDVYFPDLAKSWTTNGLASQPIVERKTVLSARKYAASKGRDLLLAEFGLVSNTGSDGASLTEGLFSSAVAIPSEGQSRIIGVSYFNSVTGTFGYTMAVDSPLYTMIYKTLPINSNATHWSSELPGATL